MIVLVLDTTTRGGSCALARDGIVMAERAGDVARAQELQLPGELMALLDACGVTLPSIDAFAVATGPGSFTGLRVGIAAMQGLAFAAGKPLIGVSAMDALAAVAAADALTAIWVDAWRGEVYAALYDGTREVEETTVEKPEAILARLADHEGPRRSDGGAYVFIGDAASTYRDLILETLGDRARIAAPATPLLAGTIARIATIAVNAGDGLPPHAIRPLYVRRLDAPPAHDVRHPR